MSSRRRVSVLTSVGLSAIVVLSVLSLFGPSANARPSARGVAKALPPERTFSDPRFTISFNYPARVQIQAVRLTKPYTAGISLFMPGTGYLEILRYFSPTQPGLPSDLKSIEQQLAEAYLHGTGHRPKGLHAKVVHGLPVITFTTGYYADGSTFGPGGQVVDGNDIYTLEGDTEPSNKARRYMAEVFALLTRSVRPVPEP